MSGLFYFALVFTLIYCITLFVFWIGLFRPSAPRSDLKPGVSVIVAVKNEATNLAPLVNNLTTQDYSQDLYEIILVDNDSTDNTYQLIKKYEQDIANVRAYSTREIHSEYEFKKEALDLGIRQAKGEIILETDADTQMRSSWISTMVSYFSPEVGMVVGFTAIENHPTVFTQLQTLDYLLLMAAARGTINLGIFWGCSASNFAFRKALYHQIGGYHDIADRVGGDDSLFLQLVSKKAHTRVRFADAPGAWVKTKPATNAFHFLRQRMRWASYANYAHRLTPAFFSVAVVTFLANLAPLLFVALLLCGSATFVWTVILIGLKFICEGSLAWQATRLFGYQYLRKLFPLWFLVQMPYIVIMGILSFVGNRARWS